MQIVEYRSNRVFPFRSEEPEEFPVVASAVTVGAFDGVHRGHRKIISRMVSIARQRALRSVVVTFDPHPRRVLGGEVTGPLGLLTTLEEKITLLRSADVDLLFVVRFTPEFAMQSSEEFIKNVLVGLLGAKSIVIGYDHGFGRNRSGSGDDLRRLGLELGFTVDVESEVRIADEHFSSTRIRQLLGLGRIEEANAFLGSFYTISGTVVEGDGRGRGLGFPTVNIHIPDPHKLLPQSGVYVAESNIDGLSWMAMMNVGVRPTVEDGGRTSVEAHILGWEGSLYGRELSFNLLHFIRRERKFPTLEALRQQLEKDKKTVELYC
ncbi:riboflavin biosynthesis protein RibF [Pelodictyon luteolum]|uniref:Riboflavin biosynthesis protein n=1 Tax=Chlorobium luteolum (strain DSM 273 / BCRC 81028 / 2530) TaxID=319225 RepID=Q3B201_CHLL3|nr:riboflavin biosynthesis protein RibF [Pelodictyon luteolum]ABB24630.1 FMN adenylyltransferase / riboflavin kinase [Pelodictyon luteolum DSM 273]